MSSTDVPAIQSCHYCNAAFASRNALFKHLRESTACVADKHLLPEAPSERAKKVRKRNAEEFISRQRVTTKQNDAPLDVESLWFGDLPLPWTRLGGKYKRLKAMMRSLLPENIPDPWIKEVKRKAYRNDQGVYLGYAILAFRDKEECRVVQDLLNGAEVAVEEIFSKRDSTSCKDFYDFLQSKFPPFTLRIQENLKSDKSDRHIKDVGLDTTVPIDPPLCEQLRPLSTEELMTRWSKLTGEHLTDGTTDFSHQQALDYATLAYERGPRRQIVRCQGRKVPQAICHKLRHILQHLRWVVPNHRRGISAERYLVLLTKVATDVVYNDLRDACKELMEWVDKSYFYSGIAVTKNFVGSPHIDHRDLNFQYAISFGDIESGGELCVDGVDEKGNEVIHVVNTLNRIAAIDGRRVHWVRRWVGKDRYSLIFYDTSGKETPRLVTGVQGVETLNCS